MKEVVEGPPTTFSLFVVLHCCFLSFKSSFIRFIAMDSGVVCSSSMVVVGQVSKFGKQLLVSMRSLILAGVFAFSVFRRKRMYIFPEWYSV